MRFLDILGYTCQKFHLRSRIKAEHSSGHRTVLQRVDDNDSAEIV